MGYCRFWPWAEIGKHDYAGVATDMDADELLAFSKGFKDVVEEWVEREALDRSARLLKI